MFYGKKIEYDLRPAPAPLMEITAESERVQIYDVPGATIIEIRNN